MAAVQAMKHLVEGENLREIYSEFGKYWRKLTSDSQLRWIGPEKGVTHLAVAAIINALWDLWAKLNNLPVWKLLADMDPKVSASREFNDPKRGLSTITNSFCVIPLKIY